MYKINYRDKPGIAGGALGSKETHVAKGRIQTLVSMRVREYPSQLKSRYQITISRNFLEQIHAKSGPL